MGGIGCGNLSLPSKRQPIVPGVPHSAPCLSSMEISTATTCSLWPLAGSWKVSQVSCSQPWLRGKEQQVLKSLSPQERLPSLTWITNVFPLKFPAASPQDAKSIPVGTSSRTLPEHKFPENWRPAPILCEGYSVGHLLPDPQPLHLHN